MTFEDLEIKFKGKWHDSLMWCPTQLEIEFYVPHTIFTPESGVWALYCRWRHQDPYTFHLFKRDEKNNEKFKFWIELGSGMKKEDKIKDVHKFAEDLLLQYAMGKMITEVGGN